MEPKKKQVAESVYRFVQEWWPWLLNLGVLILIASAVASLSGCASSKQALTEHSTRDSVVYTYKTLYRDSLRIKDSTVISRSVIQRDSIVLKVDKITGEVLSRDTWHWKDTDKDRNHITDVRNMAEKSDSAAFTASKSDKRIIRRVKQKKPSEAKKTRYWKTYWLGMLSGVLLSFGWKYRKAIVGLLKKITGFL
jgi:hypothetical protein